MALFATGRESGCHVVRVDGGFEVLRVARIALRRQPLKLSRRCSFVARFAVDSRVRTDQREAILVVANRRDRNVPALDGMTRLAIRSELSPVNVRVAIRAFLSHVCKNEFHVTLDALHFFVHPSQGIACFVVAKFRHATDGLPTEGRMAVFTRNCERAVRIARDRFLPGARLPLAESLKRE